MSSETIRLDRTAVEWRPVDDEVVALDLRDSMYLGTNRTAAVLWQMLAKGATREELSVALVERFEVDRPEADESVDAFVAELERRKLLEQ